MSNAAVNQSKLMDVRHFGAKGDGTTDDTAAIQSAINAGTARVVFLPAGTYKITAPLTLRDGGDSVALMNCLSRNDTIGAVIAAPHVVVKGSATRVFIDGFRRDNSGTYTAPSVEIDTTAATSVVLGRHNFTAGKISSSGKISTITTSPVV